MSSRLTPPHLSKSRVQSGTQCALKLWYECYQREFATPPSASLQHIFDQGTKVGEVAQGRYPGGLLIAADYREPDLALEQTVTALARKETPSFYEPAFKHKNVLVRVDVLQRASKTSFDLIEVKSTARVKNAHLRDVAIQYWVARGAGVSLRRAGVLTINSGYVFDGVELDLDELFTFHDLTDEILLLQDDIDVLVDELQLMILQPEAPAIEPGEHCHDPYDCQYWEHCTRDAPKIDFPVKGLRRLQKSKRIELGELGIEEIADVPADFPLKPLQARIRNCVIENKPWVSNSLRAALENISYPVHHLDFETMGPVIPRYQGTSPFQAIPMQYSNHREEADGSIVHLEYLAEPGADPRREFAERLIADLGSEGSICVYSNYEKTVINKLAAVFPDLAPALKALVARIWDLMKVLEKHYYHPAFKGSFSIKSVLPAMVPSLSYDELNIHDGMQAAREYERALEIDDAEERKTIFENLREYCALDTWAMVELRRALKSSV